MPDPFDLTRFVDAQEAVYPGILAELRSGAKRTHWIWFVFPQLAGLGRSSVAQFYAISCRDEALAFLEHPLLGVRLRDCVRALLAWAGIRSADQILGSVDSMKLRSSLTLFDALSPGDLFADGLAAFYAAEPDPRTLALLNGAR